MLDTKIINHRREKSSVNLRIRLLPPPNDIAQIVSPGSLKIDCLRAEALFFKRPDPSNT